MRILLIGCDTFIISPLVPLIVSNLKINVSSGGYLVTAYSIFYVIFSPVLGPLSDRIGRKKMIYHGMFIFAIASIATGLSTNLTFILLSRCLTGIGAAFAAPSVWSYIGDYFDSNERGKATGIIASALSLGMIIGVPLGSFLAEVLNWKGCFYVLGGFSICIAICIKIFFPEIKIKKVKEVRFKEVFSQNIIIFSFCTTLCIAFANFGLYTFLGYWLNLNFDLKVSQVGIFLIIAGVGNLIGMQLGGFLGDKFKRKNIALISIIFMAFSLLIIPIFNHNLYFTGICIFIWLLTGVSAFSTMQVIITQLNEELRGTIVAINNSFMWTGTALGSAIVSLIINHFNFTFSSIFCSIVALLGGLALKIFVYEK